MRFLPVAATVAVVLVACGDTLSNGDENEVVDIGSVRLFDSRGAELTQHMPLVAGQTTRVQVRLYGVDASEITSIPGGVEVNFTFSPAVLASSTPVQGQQLSRDVMPTSPPFTGGSLSVSVRLVASGLVESFGPFDVLVH